MKIARTLALCAAMGLATVAGGCSIFQDLAGSLTGGSAAQANTAFAAESFLKAAEEASDSYITNAQPSVAVTQTIQGLDSQLYAEIVKVRTAAQSGDSVTLQVALDAFNGAFANLSNYLAGLGVSIATPGGATPPPNG